MTHRCDLRDRLLRGCPVICLTMGRGETADSRDSLTGFPGTRMGAQKLTRTRMVAGEAMPEKVRNQLLRRVDR